MSALLGNIGIQGSQAGTAMRAMMNRLTQPAALGIEAMEQINLEVSDAEGNLRAMPDILRDINSATRDMGSTERKSILQRIFGAEAGSGMAELVDSMSEGKLDNLIAALHNTAGENMRMAGTMANNLRGDLDSLTSAWQSIGIEMSEVNDGPLRSTTQWITGLLLKISGWIADNPKLAQTLMLVAGTIGSVIAVLGALALAAASIAGPLLILKFSLAKIKLGFLAIFGPGTMVLGLLKSLMALIAANPITAAMIAIGAAGYFIWKNWDAIAEWFTGGGLGRLTKALFNWSPLNTLYKIFVGALKLLGANIPDMFSSLGGAIVDGLVGGIKSKFFGVDKAVSELGDTASTSFKDELGINSPSRVFAEYGANTMQGYQQGLQRSESGPLRQITSMVKRLRNIGAGALVGALGLSPAAADILPASSLRVDNRPPIASDRSGLTIQGGIHIAVTAGPGMNEQALANLVATEVQRALQQAQNQTSAKQRSALYDID
jgi:hypothetical protein